MCQIIAQSVTEQTSGQIIGARHRVEAQNFQQHADMAGRYQIALLREQPAQHIMGAPAPFITALIGRDAEAHVRFFGFDTEMGE